MIKPKGPKSVTDSAELKTYLLWTTQNYGQYTQISACPMMGASINKLLQQKDSSEFHR